MPDTVYVIFQLEKCISTRGLKGLYIRGLKARIHVDSVGLYKVVVRSKREKRREYKRKPGCGHGSNKDHREHHATKRTKKSTTKGCAFLKHKIRLQFVKEFL